MVFHVRHVLERNERNPSLRGGLLGVCPKSHNVPYWLGMRRLLSI